MAAACSPLATTARAGRGAVLRRGIRGGQVTVSLTADFLSDAEVGDWLEAHVTVNRIGKRLAHVSCDLRVGDRHVGAAARVRLPRPALPAGALPAELPLADG